MFQKILVALDNSSQATAVLDFALSVSEPNVTQIRLIHFIDSQVQNVSPFIGLATLYDVDISEARRSWGEKNRQREMEISKNWLENFQQKATALGLDCQVECLVGNCYLGIGDRAKDWNADAIVIGRRGHKGLSEVFLGSVSNYVVHHAPCSILVVQENETTKVKESTRTTEMRY